MGYKFRIEYKKGISNKAVDAPDRDDPSDVATMLTAVAHPVPRVLEVLRNETVSFADMLS